MLKLVTLARQVAACAAVCAAAVALLPLATALVPAVAIGSAPAAAAPVPAVLAALLGAVWVLLSSLQKKFIFVDWVHAHN